MPFTVTGHEVLDVVIITVVVGYIFKDIFKAPKRVDANYDPVAQYKRKLSGFEDFRFAALVTAPAIILHELSHKLVAVALGLHATFHAAYTWLVIGLLLKILGTGIIFFVPAFVSITGALTPLSNSAVAFAGPGMNLFIFLVTWGIERYSKVPRNYYPALVLTKRINMFLFIFNMLPFPFFDGFKVYQGIFQTFF